MRIGRLVLTMVALAFALTSEAKFEPPSRSEVAKCVSSALEKPHPRLFADGEAFARLREEIKSPGIKQRVAKRIIRRADRLMDGKPIGYKKEGAYLYGVANHEVMSRILGLAMAARLTEKRKYINRAVVEVKEVCSWPNWNTNCFLNTASLCSAVGIAYDWLYNDMSEADREEIRRGFVKNGFEPVVGGGFWVDLRSNWGQVCNGGATIAALALMDSDRERAIDVICRSVKNVTHSMNCFAPIGAYPEGPGYWGFGTDYNTMMLFALESVFDTEFGLCEMPGFLQTGNFIELSTGPSGQTFNFSDARPVRGLYLSSWWLARKNKMSAVLRSYDVPHLDQAAKSDEYYMPEYLTLILLCHTEPKPEDKVELPLAWNSLGPNPFTVQRSGWEREDLFVGIKAGRPGFSHGQQDIGSFVMDAGGVRWVSDLGNCTYAKVPKSIKDFFGWWQEADRWLLLRNNVRGHNTIRIGEEDQITLIDSKILSVSEGAESEVVLDMTPNYNKVAKKVIRTGKMLPGGKKYRISDHIEGVKPGTPIYWTIYTQAKAKLDGEDVVLTQEGKTMKIRRKVPEGASAWKIVEDPRWSEKDEPNPGIAQISFSVPMSEKGPLDFAVGFVYLGEVSRDFADK